MFRSGQIEWQKLIAFVCFMMILAGIPSVSIADLNNGLVAYYSFDGNSNDESGNGIHGTVIGATLTEDRLGNIGRAYEFDGSDDYIEVGNSESLNFTSSFTVSLWIRAGTLGLEQRLAGKGVAPDGRRCSPPTSCRSGCAWAAIR